MYYFFMTYILLFIIIFILLLNLYIKSPQIIKTNNKYVTYKKINNDNDNDDDNDDDKDNVDNIFDPSKNRLYIYNLDRLDDQIIKLLKKIDIGKDFEIVIHSDGGYADNAIKIIYFMIRYKNKNKNRKIKAYVPYKAYSMACFIALIADELYANEDSYFSQIDSQIPFQDRYYDYVSAHHLVSGREKYLENYIKASINEDQYITEKLIKSNTLRYSRDEWINIMKYLMIEPKFTHDCNYTVDDMKYLGVKFDGYCPNSIVKIVDEFEEELDEEKN